MTAVGGGLEDRIAGIVLAAGCSSRMGEAHNKLVEDVGGRALVAAPVDALIGAGLAPILVVTGFEAARVRAALGDRRCELVHHDGWPEGMGSSLAHGARALGRLAPDAAAVVVCVGDLPALAPEHVRRVVAAAASANAAIDPGALVVPTCGGRRGHPVLFGADHFAALSRLAGDQGGRAILEANSARTTFVAIDDEAILVDVDTPTELARARERHGERDHGDPGHDERRRS